MGGLRMGGGCCSRLHVGWDSRCIRRFDLVNIAMVYLLAVVIVALRYPGGPAIAASILCVAAFDFLFVPPRGRFTVDDVQYLLTFAIMLAVALMISRLVESVHRQAAAQAALAIEAETERIRSALLASISHDLRTPLAVMSGASSSLAESGERLSAADRQALAQEHLRPGARHVRARSEGVADDASRNGGDQGGPRLGGLE